MPISNANASDANDNSTVVMVGSDGVTKIDSGTKTGGEKAIHVISDGVPGTSTQGIPFLLAVGAGLIPGWSSVHKFGVNRDVDSADTPEDVWSAGGEYPFPSSAPTTSIVSTSASDGVAGVGALTVEVEGLSSTWAAVTQTVTMNGTTAVNLATALRRVNRMKVITVGSNGVNVGTIDLLHTATIISRIDIDHGQTLQCIYTVPLGKTAYLCCWDLVVSKPATGAGAKTAEVELAIRTDGESWQVKQEVSVTSDIAPPPTNFSYAVSLPEKTDLKIFATSVTSNNTYLTSDILLVLRDN